MMEARRRDEKPGAWKAMRCGWCGGDERSRQELLEQMGGKMGQHLNDANCACLVANCMLKIGSPRRWARFFSGNPATANVG